MPKILLIHTGGTIGMVQGPQGLTPAQGVVEQAARALAPSNSQIAVHTFTPLVDSANIGGAQWNAILDLIADWDGTGVVITHGTDTMPFTGAALSQALAGIDKPIVLCGAMHPLGTTPGDAEGNLAQAMAAAHHGPVGVWLAFGGQLLDASGLVKHHSSATAAFRATAQPRMTGPLHRRRFAPRRVAIITLSPGLPAAAVAAMLSALDGAVLRVFGAGTMMDDPALVAVLADAVARGCPITAVSQCELGGLTPGAYAAGAGLWAAGVRNGGTATAEAALAAVWLDLSPS